MPITRTEADAFIKELLKINKSTLFTIQIAGSYRRGLERINDIDILMISKKQEWDKSISSPVESIKLPGDITETNAGGIHRLTTIMCRIPNVAPFKIKCDIYAVDKKNLPYALLHSTGDRGTNLGMRRLAMDKGWLLNQYGLWYRNRPNVRVAGTENIKTEKEVFEKLGHPYKHPEKRDHKLNT
jgi:DNA polymerase (family 10)